MTFIQRITSYIRANFPALSIETSEEPRALGDVLAAVEAAPPRGMATGDTHMF